MPPHLCIRLLAKNMLALVMTLRKNVSIRLCTTEMQLEWRKTEQQQQQNICLYLHTVNFIIND